MKRIFKIYNFCFLLVILILANPAFANRLEEAAMRGQSIVISIGQVTAVIGIVLGGIALSIGMANVGKMILMSGIIGAAATFGGPALIEVFKEIFR